MKAGDILDVNKDNILNNGYGSFSTIEIVEVLNNLIAYVVIECQDGIKIKEIDGIQWVRKEVIDDKFIKSKKIKDEVSPMSKK
jgi:hypothetical protein